MQPKRNIVLSGMRPTADGLHLGNYEGALREWVRQQAQSTCYFFIADLHALTTAEPGSMFSANTHRIVSEWIGAGIDPSKSTLFIQSLVPEHAELHTILSMITPVPWLLRNPTIKEQAAELGIAESGELTGINLGFLGYPVLQAADILLYGTTHVPVGADQEPHIELTRKIARRFNDTFAVCFPEPKSMVTGVGRLPGIDGGRMSKSKGNTINLSDDSDTLKQKVGQMFTDPKKVRRNDPGHPQECPVYQYYQLYALGDELAEVHQTCSSGARGCVACKGRLTTMIDEHIAPIREVSRSLIEKPDELDEILVTGSKSAQKKAANTVRAVREAIGLPDHDRTVVAIET